MSASTPISILIRTFNSEKTLDAVLSMLPRSRGDEVVIVDSGSTDSTLTIARRHEAKILCSDPPFNYSRALNEGFQASCNSWVMVISSHCIPTSPGMLERLREIATDSDPNLAVIYGVMSLKAPQKVTDGIIIGNQEDWLAGRFRFGGNGLALYRRECWALHPFDESLPTAEDLAWFISATKRGHMAAIANSATVLYRNQGKLRHMFRKGHMETLVARKMIMPEQPQRSVIGIFHSLFLNLGHVGKLLLKGQIDLRTFTRQSAHAVGVFHATWTTGRIGGQTFLHAPSETAPADKQKTSEHQ